jgi:TrmH family RNA methyltransferase
MISKNRIKLIQSLRRNKVRNDEQLYIIEGDKLVKDYILSGRTIKLLAAKPDFLKTLDFEQKALITEIETVNVDELKQISALVTPHNALAIVQMSAQEIIPSEVFKGLSVALDFIQDPGNLGTIIRAAAWFGIGHIICSENCVDVYNPKVVQASMGALLNVNVGYFDLSEFLAGANENGVAVYGTLLDGESIYSAMLVRKAVILLGNESKGISPDLLPFISNRLAIPKFTASNIGIDSLNAGMAASIIFSEFARRFL